MGATSTAEIPSIEPLTFRAGDTIKWTKTLTNYSSAEWDLIYNFRGPDTFDVTATASGTAFLVALTAAESLEVGPGVYRYQGKVFNSDVTEQWTVAEGRVEIFPCMADVDSGYEARTPARVSLDAINAVIQNRATQSQLEWTIQAAGRSVRHMGPEELAKWLQFFQAEVAREEAAVLAERGENPGNMIVVEFRNP